MELRSSDVPSADRFDWWCELTARDLVPTRITIDRTAVFRAAVSQLELGGLQASVLEFSALRSVRTRRLVERSDPDWWELALVRAGSLQLTQNRNQTALQAGDLVLYDTSRPFVAEVSLGLTLASLVVLHLPRRVLPIPEQKLRNLVARPMPSRTGAGILLARFMAGCAEQTTAIHGGVGRRLEPAAVGLATAFLADLADTEDRIPAQTRQQALLVQIKTFVLDHLHEPRLSPAMIAEAHHISVRYLHHLFHEDGQNLGGFIRCRRLERCHTDLADPRLIHLSVAEVGARWGLQDGASFNRAFKAAYGIPPGEHRRRR
ncbi:helix-turn-helix domain-containing protein [Actinoallomurus sp. NPDC052308]|uniref:AraC-like ligand-binding domain-containing protein n=1 Tax=Actinoallomurus sp. NPDC052308 TaxID=3155530 RepID=UPI00343BFB47